jgi:hypothetical protein
MRSAVIEPHQMMSEDEPKSTQLREVIVEFGRHLDMLAEQLGASVMEADRECVSVGESFHEMATARNTIAGIRCAEPERSVLHGSCKQIGESLHTAVVALQYHDRLAQRLGLVRAGLSRLQTLLHDESPRSYDEWLESLRDVEHTNRVEQRRLGPATIDDDAVSGPDPDMSQSSVELF